MINTKQNPSATENERLGFEEAIAKGKLYNPLSGKELLEFLIRHIKGMLLAADPPLDPDLADQIATYVRGKIQNHPALDTEVQAYPKADVRINIGLGQALPDTSTTKSTAGEIDILVTKHPREEKRGFGIVVDFRDGFIWDAPPLLLTSELNLDEIPPDALRILNDMPVPTPRRLPGSGPSGEATIVDEPKVASEQQKGAVERQFSSAPATIFDPKLIDETKITKTAGDIIREPAAKSKKETK